MAEVLATAANENSRARICYHKALEQAKSEGLDEFIVCSIRLSYAGLLTKLGEIEEALKQLITAQNGFKKQDATRDYAITIGQIARIRVDKGEVDSALALHEERLKIARSLGDMDSIGASQWDLAQIDLQREDFESAVNRLAEAWGIFDQTGRVDGLAAVGNVFGQLLCAFEQFDQAKPILLRTREALMIMGRMDEVPAIDALITKCQ